MSEDRGVGAVILAAGGSRRYGSPKQLVTLSGRTLLEHAISGAAQSGLTPVVAVVPVWLLRAGQLDAPGLRWVRNPFPERGMGLSLRLGLGAMADDVSAAIILLGDQPRVPGATIDAVLKARGRRPLIAASAEGVLAPPVLIERSHFWLADGIVGDVGFRHVLHELSELVTAVPVAAHPSDLDTPADLDRVAREVMQ